MDRPCHGGSALDGVRFEIVVKADTRKEKVLLHLLLGSLTQMVKRTFKLRDILVWSLLVYYKVIYTFRYINSKI